MPCRAGPAARCVDLCSGIVSGDPDPCCIGLKILHHSHSENMPETFRKTAGLANCSDHNNAADESIHMKFCVCRSASSWCAGRDEGGRQAAVPPPVLEPTVAIIERNTESLPPSVRVSCFVSE